MIPGGKFIKFQIIKDKKKCVLTFERSLLNFEIMGKNKTLTPTYNELYANTTGRKIFSRKPHAIANMLEFHYSRRKVTLLEIYGKFRLDLKYLAKNIL